MSAPSPAHPHPLLTAIVAVAGGAQLRVKVVPGASRSRIAGLLGERLKIQIAAPPEAGKANQAVCALLARTTGLSRQQVQIVAGTSQPLKTVFLAGLSPAALAERLEAAL